MARKTKPSTRRPARRMRKSNRRVARLSNSEFASAKETFKYDNDNMGELYTVYNTRLSNFDRLAAIAKGYQYYRITKIEMKFIPHADTFTQGAQTTVPTLYWLIDRNENTLFSATGFDQIREAGAKPIRFDDKMVRVTWRPNVLQTMPADNLNPPASSAFTLTRLSPWLPTNQYAATETAPYQWAPSTIPHRGLIYGVYQESPVGTTYQYHTEITVHAQFKKPAVVYSLKEGESFSLPVDKDSKDPAPLPSVAGA